ncbi:MAG: hypothetical protein FJY10_04605 [Bacteroidetes bacterium]|nr:hypothetical protein [Bacteroidota bacterium]
MKRDRWLWIVIGVIFLLRLASGLVSEFWEEDELQIYLLGLKFYTTGLWPYFGPDVVYTQTQIPGALQGLLVGLPFYLWPIPEAPFLLLNLLTFPALCLLCRYVEKRVTGFPRWLLWIWILTLSWGINFGTRMVNPSYVLIFSIPFFLGFLEMMPIYQEKLLKPGLCAFLMGLALTCIMQLHLSWVLLVPFILAVVIFLLITDAFKWRYIFQFLAGTLIGLITLIPTLLLHGLSVYTNSAQNVSFQTDNYLNFFTILTRLMAFGSWDAPYMLSGKTWRMMVIQDYPWMEPLIYIMVGFCFILVAFFIISFFIRRKEVREWGWIKWIMAATVLLLYLNFFFSIKGPSPHTFFILFPLVVLYTFYCFQRMLKYSRILRTVMLIVIVVGIALHIGIGMFNYHHFSLYKEREKIEQAIDKKDYKVVGLRRADQWGKGY